MTKAFNFAILAVASICSADTGGSLLPKSISEDVKSSYDSAAKALVDRDIHLALAMYEGVLIEGGISVRIDEASADSPSQLVAVDEAIDTWHAEMADDFPIRRTTNPDTAQVTIRFVDYLPEGEGCLGKIHLTKNYRWNSKKHTVTYNGEILIVKSAGGVRLERDELRDVVMHEFGHLLGLADSSEAGTLMGELIRGRPAPRPNKSEVSDVVNLRRLTRQKIREINGF